MENELPHPIFWSVICRQEIYEHISKRVFYHHELSRCKKLGEQYLPILCDKFKVVHHIPISLSAMLGISTVSSPPLLLKAYPSHRRSELHLTQPCGTPEQHKDILTAAATTTTLVHTILLLCCRCKHDAKHHIVQVREPLRECGTQCVGPQQELVNWHILTLYSLRILFAKLRISSKGTLGTKVSTCVCCGKDGSVVWCCTVSRLKTCIRQWSSVVVSH